MKKNMQLLGQSANRVNVLFDPISSHAATHFEDTPELREIFIEVLSTIELDGSEIAQDINVGRIIGTSDVVATNDYDEITYAARKNRAQDGLVPFVKNRTPKNCSTLAYHMRPIDSQMYELSSVWIGVFDAIPFPGVVTANEESFSHWSRHAFIHGSQEIILETETDVCPW